MSFFRTMSINASAMSANQLRLDIVSQNLANAETTRTESGGPYRRKVVHFEEISDGRRFSATMRSAVSVHQQSTTGRTRRGMDTMVGLGVRVREITEDPAPNPMVYDPEHPDADENGYVHQSNVNVVYEMVNMLSANRSFEANLTAFNTTKAMAQRTLEISQSR
jgi:flagellar basal-body rod protein FlgC